MHDLMLVLNFVCVTYSILLCKLATSFATLSIFILLDKNGKLL